MDPITQKKQRRAAILDELKTFSKAAQALGRGFSEEERTKIEALKAENETLAAEIKTAEADEETRKYVESLSTELEAPEGRKTQPDKLGTVGNPRDAFLDDPKRGFKDHREFLTAVMDAPRLGRVDNRLKSLKSSSTEQLAAGADEHGTHSDPYGNYFVPKAFSPEQLKLDSEGNPMAGLVRSIPMTTPSISFNARVDKNHSTSVSGGLRVYRRKETQTVEASRMEHEQVELKAGALFGVAHVTEELLSRSLISFIALLDAGFSDEFNAKLVNERLNGTGVGEFEGVLKSPSKIAVTKEDDQAADSIVKENIDNMRTRCWRYGSAVWMANHGTLPMLRSLVQVIGTGGVAVPYFTTSPDGQAMLDGRPLFFSEFCQALGDEGDLILVNWSEYLEGTLTSMSNAESMHVRFLEHERTFKFWMENDARCWWRSALTPKNGPTRSPIVTLAARA